MSKCLESRLNGRDKEFCEDAEVYGVPGALRLWEDRLDGYHDIIGTQKYLEKKNMPNLGIRPLLNGYSPAAIADCIVERLFNHVVELHKRLEEKDRIIEQYQRKEDYNNAQRTIKLQPQIRQIMELCKEG